MESDQQSKSRFKALYKQHEGVLNELATLRLKEKRLTTLEVKIDKVVKLYRGLEQENQRLREHALAGSSGEEVSDLRAALLRLQYQLIEKNEQVAGLKGELANRYVKRGEGGGMSPRRELEVVLAEKTDAELLALHLADQLTNRERECSELRQQISSRGSSYSPSPPRKGDHPQLRQLSLDLAAQKERRLRYERSQSELKHELEELRSIRADLLGANAYLKAENQRLTNETRTLLARQAAAQQSQQKNQQKRSQEVLRKTVDKLEACQAANCLLRSQIGQTEKELACANDRLKRLQRELLIAVEKGSQGDSYYNATLSLKEEVLRLNSMLSSKEGECEELSWAAECLRARTTALEQQLEQARSRAVLAEQSAVQQSDSECLVEDLRAQMATKEKLWRMESSKLRETIRLQESQFAQAMAKRQLQREVREAELRLQSMAQEYQPVSALLQGYLRRHKQ